ncbi:unnamed protein product, partial [Linum tenue]
TNLQQCPDPRAGCTERLSDWSKLWGFCRQSGQGRILSKEWEIAFVRNGLGGSKNCR